MADVSKRTLRKKSLQKYFRKINDHLTGTTPMSYSAVITLQEQTKAMFSEIMTISDQLISTATGDEAIQIQHAEFSSIEDLYQEILNAISDALLTLPNPALKTAAGGSGSTSGPPPPPLVRLPATELPTFDGDYANWMSFKDLFVALVDSNSSLAPSQKLQYLKGCLEAEPAALIKNMPITDLNYPEAWKTLKERYENTNTIVFTLIERILKLKHVQGENPKALQSLLDQTCESLRALEVLQQPVDKWDCLLISILLHKMDATTRKEWAIRQTSTAIPTFEQFKSFLSTHIRGLIASAPSPQTPARTKEREEYKIPSHQYRSQNVPNLWFFSPPFPMSGPYQQARQRTSPDLSKPQAMFQLPHERPPHQRLQKQSYL